MIAPDSYSNDRLVDEREQEMLRVLEVTIQRVRKARRGALRRPIPRHTCPGCFSAIYEGAAEQGWCCDCYPLRESYERGATGGE